MKTAWFFALIASICFQGLGRRYLPAVPSAAFYFLEGRGPPVRPHQVPASALHLPGAPGQAVPGFHARRDGRSGLDLSRASESRPPVGCAGGDRLSRLLALVARAATGRPRLERTEGNANVRSTSCSRPSGFVAILAAIQFAAPADSAVHIYSYVDGEQVDQAIVYSTGRARVASTFSFLSGFSDFTMSDSNPGAFAGTRRPRSQAAPGRVHRHRTDRGGDPDVRVPRPPC